MNKENDEERVAYYLGRVIALLSILQERYKNFNHIFTFNIFCDDNELVAGCHTSEVLDNNDINDLMYNINKHFLQKNPDGINFDKQLEDILNELRIDSNGEDKGDDKKG